MNFIERYKYYLGGLLLIIVALGAFFSYQLLYQEAEIIPELAVAPPEELVSSFYVDVKGAVKKPGVYEFKEGAIVFDAINKAGGLTKSGNTSNINLSQKLTEAMVVYIFTSSEIKKGSNKITCDTTCNCETVSIDNELVDNTNKSTNQSNKVNLNTASLNELITLPGIGESKAKAIIEYRSSQGLFTSIQDITKVSGIGQSTFENLKDLITI